MVNDKFYRGYEGEGQVIFSDENKNKIVIWEGYLYVLMERMLDQGYKILADFYSRDNDDSAWLIPNINNALAQFQSFDYQRIQQDGFTECFPELITTITRFLWRALNSQQKVYLDKD